ncbi:hypothetical protein TELCIR_14910 [Teladorsagia circumcincta]|uniref:PAZ domain-containing protein n=1 Tax=Teladorsagia circumcincta TaxID=45464 RepID=A0A2G9TZM5_TELCI|nr:hypothetical protein TELCIR_14910 [Teladorsagia circumcincta]
MKIERRIKGKGVPSDQAEGSVLTNFYELGLPTNPYWPAVKLVVRKKLLLFPMEVLQVEPNQRVPVEKQQAARCVGFMPTLFNVKAI